MITVLKVLVIGLGASLCMGAVIILLEGYGQDNPSAEPQG